MALKDSALETAPAERAPFFFGAYFFWHWAEGFQTVLFSWYVVTHVVLAPPQVGFFQSLTLMPYLAFIPFGGWVANRFGPKLVYLVASVLFAATMFLYGSTDVYLGFSGVLFGLYCIAVGVFSALANPAIDAFIPESGKGTTERNTLDAATVHNVAKLSGTVTTAFVLGVSGAWTGFILNGILILLAALFFGVFAQQLTQVRRRSAAVTPPPSPQGFRDAIRYVRSDPMAFDIILSSTLLGLFMAPVGFVLWPLLVRENFAASQDSIGLVYTMFWIGSIVSTRYVARIIDGLNRRVAVAFGLWASAMVVALAVYALPNFVALCAGVFLYGVVLSPAKAIVFGLYLRRIPVAQRALLISFDKAAFWGMATFGTFLFGTLIGVFGVFFALAVNASVFIGGLVFLALRGNIRSR